MAQLELDYRGRGGPRQGAGRPKCTKETVPHGKRPRHEPHQPVHVTLRLRKGLPRLRRKEPYRVLRCCFRVGRDRFGFRLVHYAVLSNHLHLIVEAKDRRALSRGMQGLAIRVAKRLNASWGRKGSVFFERYHGHALRTPREVRNALAYVLNNARKHGVVVPWGVPDPFSSGDAFAGWREGWFGGRRSPPVADAGTYLLRWGWRKHGLIGLLETPGRR